MSTRPRKHKIASPLPVSPEELKHTLSLLEATLEATADGILVVDREGKIAAYNRRFVQMWGIPDSILESGDDDAAIAYVLSQLKDPDVFVARVRELYARPDAGSTDVLEFKDGRIVERVSQPQRIAGRAVGRVWSFRDITARRRAEQVQHATYRISQATIAADNLYELLQRLHEIVGELMPAKNFYVALVDRVNRRLAFPYFVDERDPDSASKPLGRGLTEYVIRTGEPLLATPEIHDDLIRRGEAEMVGPPSIDWLGVPLRVRDEIIGAIVVQSYEPGVRYRDAEQDLLTFVSSHVALAVERQRADELRREQGGLLQRVVDHIPVMLAFIDDQGRISWGNREWSRVLGYTVEEARTTDVLAALYPDAAERARVHASIGAPAGEWTDFRTRLRNGRVIETTWANAPLPGGGYLAIGLDVTERRRTEQAVHESRQLLHAVVEGSLDAVFAKDREGRYLFMNSVAAATLKMRPEDAVGLTDAELFPAEIAGRFADVDRRIMDTGEIVVFEDTDAAFGGAHTFLITKGPLRRSDGQIIGVFGVARDITDRQAAEQAVRQSEERYRSFIEQSTEGVSRLELEPAIPVTLPADEQVALLYARGIIAECNDAMARMYGFERAAELVGARLAQLHDPAEPRNRESLRAFVRSGYRLVDSETRELDRHGRARVFLNNVVGFVADGRLVRVWGSQRDVTDQRRLEEQFRQAQKMEAVGRLAGGIAHDFNNILTAVLGTCQLLERELPGDAPAVQDVREIKKAALRAADLTRQLLAYSRRQVLAPKVLDLNAAVSGLDAMLRRVVGEDVELAATLAPGVGRVRADPSQIEQVILNLVVNARDAMPAGGRLTLATSNVEFDATAALDHAGAVPGRYVTLEVADTGTGIPPEVRAHLFEPFFTTKDVGKGTGLGLATVYGIVKQSSGFISVTTDVGRGTSFRIHLPRVEAEPPAMEPRVAEPGPLSGTETVLVAEDEAAVRQLSQRALEREGYTVLTAADGREALSRVARHEGTIHLLVTDVVMPGMGGRELARRLRRLRPAIRVLFMSGYPGEAVAQPGGIAPGAPFLQKPFMPEELVRKAREVLDGPATPAPDGGDPHSPTASG
jgi:PAS domain S-box-containing protein